MDFGNSCVLRASSVWDVHWRGARSQLQHHPDFWQFIPFALNGLDLADTRESRPMKLSYGSPVTEYGRPFSVAGFGNKMRDWCDQAGLPECSSHGLRKAAATTAAENGATAPMLMSMFGWLTLAEADRYTRTAERRKLAASGMGFVVRK